MINIIAAFFRIICVLLIINKLLSKKTRVLYSHNNHTYILKFLFFFVLSIIARIINPSFFTFLFISMCSIYIILVYKIKSDYAIALTLTSYAIYFLIHNICSLLIATISSPFYIQGKNFPIVLGVFTTNCLTYISILALFKNKRLRSGLTIFTNIKYINSITLFSLFVLIIKTISYFYMGEHEFHNNIIFGTPIFVALFFLALLLYTWWRQQITKTYREKLRQLELQSLYDEIAEKDKIIQKLTTDNDSLARIIHKDNKLIPAMEHAVSEYLSCNFPDTSSLKMHGTQLLSSLNTIAKDRRGILETYQNRNVYLHQTGYINIDAVLAYMQKKADAKHILIECRCTKDILTYLMKNISEEDLAHLLSDLIENALIAINNCDNGKVQIIFGVFQKEAYVSVADNGVPFDLQTLHTFGIHQHTTHADTGGSGIGLMDIWNLKKKYRASLQIQEYIAGKDDFTKKIIFSFNSKNHYVIQSYRYMELINTQTRGDLYIIPPHTTVKNGGKSA